MLRLRDELLSPVAASCAVLAEQESQMNVQTKPTPPEKQDSMRIVGSPSGRGYRLGSLAVRRIRETWCSNSFPTRFNCKR